MLLGLVNYADEEVNMRALRPNKHASRGYHEVVSGLSIVIVAEILVRTKSG